MRTLEEIVQAASAGTLAQVSSTPGALVPSPAPGVAFSSGSELITGREIAAVAGKLARHKSEDKQAVGRAMLRALKGEVWAGDGHRNTTMYKIAAELVEAYPALDSESVILCFSAAISNAQLQGSKYTEDKLRSALERIQDERRNRLEMIAALGGLGIEPGAPLPAWPTEPTPDTPGVDPRAAELNAAGWDTLIIRANGDFYLRTPDRGTFDWKLTSALDLRTKMVNLFGRENATVVTHQDGEFVGAEKICEVYARVADRTIHDYTSPATTFDLLASTLRVGLPAATPRADYDPRIEHWLTELAGGTQEGRAELYDWIGSTTREYIHRPAAALVIVGARDAGKSLFMLALAATWGVLPVKLANAIERFNGALLSSPFWHADERMPEEMTEACFREIVPERTRLVEPKGREKVELHGCGRLVFTLNSVDDLHVGAAKGADALDAVVGRIAFFDCSGRRRELLAAQDTFRKPGSWDLDLPAMVGHMRWVQENHKPREQRFLGARLDSTAARAVVLNQSTRQAEALLEALCEYLANPAAWECEYKPNGQYSFAGRAYPVVTQDGGLYIWPSEICARLRLRDVRALEPILAHGRTRIRFGLFQGSYRKVDLEKLVSVRPEVREHVVVTCSSDTRERLGLTGK